MKTFFHIKDNILDKKLTKIINESTFVSNRKCINSKVKDLIAFYAENFCSKDTAKAEREL